jgi:hypothetical protein
LWKALISFSPVSGFAFWRVIKLVASIYNAILHFLSDTIILSYNLHTSIYIKVPMLKTELTWWTDKYVKFQNPSSSNLATKFAGKIHTVARYSYLFIKTLGVLCVCVWWRGRGEMFTNLPSLSLC